MSEVVKHCPLCGRPMVVRTNSENGSEFLGCTGYRGRSPEDGGCSHTEAIPESYRMRLMGVPELPLFGETP